MNVSKQDRLCKPQEHEEDEEDMRLMESLEQQLMNEELEAERTRMEQERVHKRSERRRRNTYSGRYKSDVSVGASSSRVRHKEGDNDIKRRLSLPFGSLDQGEGRILRKSAIYPSLKGVRGGKQARRRSLVDSVPGVPYAKARKDADASVYTATTCADTNTLSSSASSVNAGSRRSGSIESLLMMDNSNYSSMGDMSSTNHSLSSTLASNRDRWNDNDTIASSIASSSKRSYGHGSTSSSRRHANFIPESTQRRPRETHRDESDFTRERYPSRRQSQMESYSRRQDQRTNQASSYSSLGRGYDREEEEYEAFKMRMSSDSCLPMPGPRRYSSQRYSRPRSSTNLSPCQEGLQRSVSMLSPCHERSERSSRSMMELPRYSSQQSSPSQSRKQGRGLSISGRRNSTWDESNNLSPQTSLANSLPCKSACDLEWTDSGDTRGTYPVDNKTERRRRMFRSQEQNEHHGRLDDGAPPSRRHSTEGRHSRRSSGYDKTRPCDRHYWRSIRNQDASVPPTLNLGPSMGVASAASFDRPSEEANRYSSPPPSPPRDLMAASAPALYGTRRSSRRYDDGSLRKHKDLSNLYPGGQRPVSPQRDSLSTCPDLSPMSQGNLRTRSVPATPYHGNPPALYSQVAPPSREDILAVESSLGLRHSSRSEFSTPRRSESPRDYSEGSRRNGSPNRLYQGTSANRIRRHPQPPASPPDTALRRSTTLALPPLSPVNAMLQRSATLSLSRAPHLLEHNRASPSISEVSSSEAASVLPPETTDEPVEFIDIAPGERAPLRGPKANRAAIVNDFYVPKVCFGCSLDLFCIKDVLYFVCPVCKVVNPMGDNGEDALSIAEPRIRAHGACTGFTFESLFEMQAEIMKEESMRGS